MVKCHVVNVHMTPLRESQHTYYQNIEHIYQVHMITCNMISPVTSRTKVTTNNNHAQDQRGIK